MKRTAKLLPFVLAVTVALLLGLSLVLYGALSLFENRSENARFKIGVAGDVDNEYMRWGMAAMQTFDETRFTIEFVTMTEEDARAALQKGTISAYVVMPQDFIDNAVSKGEIEPITFVTSAGMEGMVGLFKREITTLVTDMVVCSQKGSYGVGDLLKDNGHRDIAAEHRDRMSWKFVDLLLDRNEVYTVEERGVADGLTTVEYYTCAVVVVLLVLLGLPFAAIYVKKEYAFHRLLKARGYSCLRQVGCEFGALMSAMLLQAVMIVVTINITTRVIPGLAIADVSYTLTKFAGKLLPVLVMLAAFNMMMFELADNLVSGLLLHFFTVLGLCYVSGCLYPIYTFPSIIKTVSSVLPTGIAREYLATCFTAEASGMLLVGLLVYAAVFFTAVVLIRSYKVRGIRGDRRAKTV